MQTPAQRAHQQRLIDRDKGAFGNAIAIEKAGELRHIPLNSDLAKHIMASAWMDRWDEDSSLLHRTT